jgi:hypothetical protein
VTRSFGPRSVNKMGTPCELTRAFRNENLWIGTCFQESPDSCIQESKWLASPVFMRVLRTVTRAREFNFIHSLTARRWLRDRGALIAAMLTLEGRAALCSGSGVPVGRLDDARKEVAWRSNLALGLLFPFLALFFRSSSPATSGAKVSKAK